MTEDRGRKTEDGRQMTEDRSWFGVVEAGIETGCWKPDTG